MSSKLGSINKNQWVKGLLVAVGGAILGAVANALQNGVNLDKHFCITTLTGAGVALGAYFKATLLTGENGKPLTNK
jgi:hypothetical protein